MFSPLPSTSRRRETASTAPEAVVVLPDSVSGRLVELLLERAGLTQAEAARRMGITIQSLNQYKKRRSNPTVAWLSRLATVCGGRLLIELPDVPLTPILALEEALTGLPKAEREREEAVEDGSRIFNG